MAPSAAIGASSLCSLYGFVSKVASATAAAGAVEENCRRDADDAGAGEASCVDSIDDSGADVDVVDAARGKRLARSFDEIIVDTVFF